jgi:hypothetical protein
MENPMRKFNRRALFQTTAAVGATMALAAISKSVPAAEAMSQESVSGIRMMDVTDKPFPSGMGHRDDINHAVI